MKDIALCMHVQRKKVKDNSKKEEEERFAHLEQTKEESDRKRNSEFQFCSEFLTLTSHLGNAAEASLPFHHHIFNHLRFLGS